MQSNAIELVGILATCLTTPSFIPQAVKIIRTKDTKALSLITYVLMALGTGLWLTYGLLIGSPGLIIGNAITTSLMWVIVALKMKHG